MNDEEIKTGAEAVREFRRRIEAMDDKQLKQAVEAAEARDREASAPCRCPLRPYGPSMASGSAWETARLREWEAEHGHHPYAKARDELALALQYAESAVKREEQGKAGEAALDMVHDIYDLRRRGTETEQVGDMSEDEWRKRQQDHSAKAEVAYNCKEECCLPK